MRFDFTDLNLFRHIVEAGSITHGAARSNLALAAASTRIRKMELAFGTPLLVRAPAMGRSGGGSAAELGQSLSAAARRACPTVVGRQPARVAAASTRGIGGQNVI